MPFTLSTRKDANAERSKNIKSKNMQHKRSKNKRPINKKWSNHPKIKLSVDSTLHLIVLSPRHQWTRTDILKQSHQINYSEETLMKSRVGEWLMESSALRSLQEVLNEYTNFNFQRILRGKNSQRAHFKSSYRPNLADFCKRFEEPRGSFSHSLRWIKHQQWVCKIMQPASITSSFPSYPLHTLKFEKLCEVLTVSMNWLSIWLNYQRLTAPWPLKRLGQPCSTMCCDQ